MLSRCYNNALNLAEKYRISSIAFPAISTGIFGFPVNKAARIAFAAVLGRMDKLLSVVNIRFVLYSEESFSIHKRMLSELTKSQLF